MDGLEKKSVEWKQVLREPKLKEDKADSLITEMTSLLVENRDKSFDFKSKVLGGKGCFFKPNKLDFTDKHFGDLMLNEFKRIEMLENNNGHESTILTDDQKSQLLKLCGFDLNIKFSLLYRASVDGFAASSFHAKCDNKGKTLTIIKVKGNSNVFGGFTELGWDSSGTYKNDQNAFIFSLTNQYNQPIKIKPSNTASSIYCHINRGPCFGGDDLFISDNSNANQTSYSNLGHTYKHPTYQYQSNEAKCFLAGSYNFSTEEIEVFKLD